MTKAWQESPRGAALLRERYTSLVNHSWALENHQVFPPGTPPCHRAPSRQGQGIFWRGSTSNCLMSCKIRQVSSGAETWRIPRMDRFPMFSPGILGNFLIVPLFYIFLYYIFLNIYIYTYATHTHIYRLYILYDFSVLEQPLQPLQPISPAMGDQWGWNRRLDLWIQGDWTTYGEMSSHGDRHGMAFYEFVNGHQPLIFPLINPDISRSLGEIMVNGLV